MTKFDQPAPRQDVAGDTSRHEKQREDIAAVELAPLNERTRRREVNSSINIQDFFSHELEDRALRQEILENEQELFNEPNPSLRPSMSEGQASNFVDYESRPMSDSARNVADNIQQLLEDGSGIMVEIGSSSFAEKSVAQSFHAKTHIGLDFQLWADTPLGTYSYSPGQEIDGTSTESYLIQREAIAALSEMADGSVGLLYGKAQGVFDGNVSLLASQIARVLEDGGVVLFEHGPLAFDNIVRDELADVLQRDDAVGGYRKVITKEV